LNGVFAGQKTVNRWNYVSGGAPASVSGSFGLAFAMGMAPPSGTTSLFYRIKALTSIYITYTDFNVKNLYDTEDFYSAPFGSPQTGLQPGEAEPPFEAYGFRTNQVRTDVARGYKRFAGVPDVEVGNLGLVVAATITGLMNPLATAMSAVLTYDDEGNTVSYSPAVLGGQKYTTPSGKEAYRNYPTEALQLEWAAIGVLWEPYVEARSQMSRQRGRGA